MCKTVSRPPENAHIHVLLYLVPSSRARRSGANASSASSSLSTLTELCIAAQQSGKGGAGGRRVVNSVGKSVGRQARVESGKDCLDVQLIRPALAFTYFSFPPTIDRSASYLAD